MNLPVTKCQKKLASVWFIAAGILFVILIIQTVTGKYRAHSDEAWQWFLPNLIPTLSLMLGVFVLEAAGKATEAKTVNSFYFRLTFSLSGFYLLALALPLFSLPFFAVSPEKMIEFLELSNLWLGPLQGLVSASIGIFFVKRE